MSQLLDGSHQPLRIDWAAQQVRRLLDGPKLFERHSTTGGPLRRVMTSGSWSLHTRSMAAARFARAAEYEMASMRRALRTGEIAPCPELKA